MALSDLMGLSGHREGVAFPNGPKQQNWCFFYVGKYSLTYSVHGKKITKFDGGVISQFLKVSYRNIKGIGRLSVYFCVCQSVCL